MGRSVCRFACEGGASVPENPYSRAAAGLIDRGRLGVYSAKLTTESTMRYLLIFVLLAGLTACSGPQVTDYREREPSLRLEHFFDGPLTAHGVVKDRGGTVIRTFNATIDASWSGNTGTLVEDFVFDDGEEQQRIWTLVKTAPGTYTGTAGDVVGNGELEVSGNAVFLDYVLRIPYGDGTIDVRVDDRMYLVSPDVLINESTLNKFGVRVGELLLVIKRQPRAGA
jgi:hypothetical protein